ncbi:MAG TPA: AAA family ATPase [Caulobacteraceae bacterium]|nr:AAA family ATPase [Caulobacteraceae bacterium]
MDKLAQDYSRFFEIEAYRWESEPMLASGHFQDVIEPPSRHDIVILILWSRLGTPLPKKTKTREYRGLDGRSPVTGTEWEFEDALRAAREHGAPDILAFRNTNPAPIDTQDMTAQARSLEQLSALNDFWSRHFQDRGVFLAAYDSYHTLDDFARLLEEKLRKLLERRIKTLDADLRDQPPLWLSTPFRGLEPYEFEHAAIYFGRDALVARAIEALAARAQQQTAFLLVCGASGSGKSSLVKAAVVPRLMKPQRIEGAAFVRRVVFRPSDGGGDVILGLVQALTRGDGADGIGLPELLAPGQTAEALAKALRDAPDEPNFIFAGALGRVSEALRREGRILAVESAKLVLILDQLEELFNIAAIDETERRLFARLVGGLARSGEVWVIATMRADFWHRMAEAPELLALCEGAGRLDVAAPSLAELTEMVRRPAEIAGLVFEQHAERGLRLDSVIAERAVAAPGVLPLLSFTLQALYAEDVGNRGGRVLTFSSYDALGGLDGAIATRAEQTLAALPPTARQALPRVLRALATVSAASDQLAVSRAAPLDYFKTGSPARETLDALIAARLVVASEEGAAPMVRLAHEALLNHWQRARLQLAADRRDLETRRVIEAQHVRYQAATTLRGKRQFLLRDPDLAVALDLETRWGDELPEPVRTFIAESDGAALAATRLRWGAAALIMLCLFAALYAAKLTGDGALIAQSRFLARDSRTATDSGDSRLGGILALAALPPHIANPSRPFINAAEYALEQAWANRRLQVAYQGHTGPVEDVEFSHDGERVVTAASDDTARIWDVGRGAALTVLKGHTDRVWTARFSPDGQRVVTASEDHTARLWDARSGRTIAVLRGHQDAVTVAAFSTDGKRIVTASDDGTARLWDGLTGAPITVLKGHDGAVLDAAFSPDGSLVATASDDETARLWRADDGQPVHVLRGHADFVSSVAFSGDGKRLVTASWDGTARVWDVASGAAGTPLRGKHEGKVWRAVFSPDGKRILTASEDNTAGLWKADTGDLIALLKGHEGWVRSAGFSPDGALVVTASDDKTARLWDGKTGAPLGVLRAHDDLVNWATFSPDGATVATASDDNTADLWNVETAAAAGVLAAYPVDDPDDDLPLPPKKQVNFAEFSQDGGRVVTASYDKLVYIWDAKTRAKLRTLQGHTDTVWTARFSPDGRLVVSSSDDKTARVWDAATGAELFQLMHDERVDYAAFSPDGKRIVTACDDGNAYVWDAAAGGAHTRTRPLMTLSGHTHWVTSAVFSPDGKRIVTASYDETARIWDATTGRLLQVLRGHKGRLNGAAFSSDGKRVVTAAWDNTARVWDAQSGKQLAIMIGDTDWDIDAVFSRDGKRVLTASRDGTLRLWDAWTGAPIIVFNGHRAWVTYASFSPDDREIVSASYDKTARIWKVPPRCQPLIDAAQTGWPLEATPAEDERYFLDATKPRFSLQNLVMRLFSPFLPQVSDVCS